MFKKRVAYPLTRCKCKKYSFAKKKKYVKISFQHWILFLNLHLVNAIHN